MKPILSRSGFGCSLGARDRGVFGPVPEWKAGRGTGKSSYDTYTHSLQDQVSCKSICKVTDMKADVDENRKRGEKENTALVCCSDTISQATLI